MSVDDEDLKRIVEVLVKAERFQGQDIRNMVPGYSPRDVGLAIWSAREIVRKEHGIVFGVTPKHIRDWRVDGSLGRFDGRVHVGSPVSWSICMPRSGSVP